jgi:hypothetical protein
MRYYRKHMKKVSETGGIGFLKDNELLILHSCNCEFPLPKWLLLDAMMMRRMVVVAGAWRAILVKCKAYM